MSLGELLCRKANYYEEKRIDWLDGWRQTRIIACMVRNTVAKRPISPERFMKLPDDKPKRGRRMSKEEFLKLTEKWQSDN